MYTQEPIAPATHYT